MPAIYPRPRAGSSCVPGPNYFLPMDLWNWRRGPEVALAIHLYEFRRKLARTSPLKLERWRDGMRRTVEAYDRGPEPRDPRDYRQARARAAAELQAIEGELRLRRNEDWPFR